MNIKTLYALLGDRPKSVISDIWEERIAALLQRGDELDVPTLLIVWQEQGGHWAELFVLYKALVFAGEVPDTGLWRRIAEAAGDPWIASKIEWAETLPAPGDSNRWGVVRRATAFTENAAAVQATPAYWSGGLEAYRAAYGHAAATYLRMLMEALGEPLRDVAVPAPEYLRMRIIALIRPPYAGLWHGLYPCSLRLNWFTTWAAVDVDPEAVQAFVLRVPRRNPVYAFRADRDVRFAWTKNERMQERLVIPAGVPWCTFRSLPQCRDEVIDIQTLDPCPTPGPQALVDSNYRW